MAISDLLARLALSPVLAAQAVGVRRRALKLPEAAGPRRGRAGMGPTLVLRIIGDSSAAGVGARQQSDALAGQIVALLEDSFAVDWRLDAITGATTRSTLRRLAQMPPEHADIVITALGVNDVTRLLPLPLWLRQQRALIDRLRSLYQPRQIYLTGVPPMGAFPLLPQPLRWTLGRQATQFDRALAGLAADQPDLTHVPFNLPPDPRLMAEDGFHPNRDLYALWAREMASRITSDWPKTRSS